MVDEIPKQQHLFQGHLRRREWSLLASQSHFFLCLNSNYFSRFDYSRRHIYINIILRKFSNLGIKLRKSSGAFDPNTLTN